MVAPNRSNKPRLATRREVWQQIKAHMPETAGQVTKISQTFGISRIQVKTPDGIYDTGRLTDE